MDLFNWISNFVSGSYLLYGTLTGSIRDYTRATSVTLPQPESLLDYYENFQALKAYMGNDGDYTSPIWW